MEIPYAGRAIINDTFDGLEIIIPSKKNWFLIVFLGFWLVGWTLGETAALAAITGFLGELGPQRSFVLLWLIFWTIAGFFTLSAFLWNLLGKEIITAIQGQLTIAKKGALFYRTKMYNLNEAQNFRIQQDNYSGKYQRRRKNGFWFGGIIAFDYGMKTVRFGLGIDEAEAKFILSKLFNKRILTEMHVEKPVN